RAWAQGWAHVHPPDVRGARSLIDAATCASHHINPAANVTHDVGRHGQRVGKGMNAMRTVLMTGAAGGIGTRLRRLLKGVYPGLRLSDLKAPPDLAPDEEFVAADLADVAAVEEIVDGVEGIVHLGGHSVEGPWETILSANVVGCYNLFEAARRKAVKRI